MSIKKNIYIKIRENLKEKHRHMAIPQFGSAVICTNKNNEILLLKKNLGSIWVVPGGVQELGESLKATAQRELFEETGIDYPEKYLELIDIFSGEGRHKTYPNGDEVYNNTALYHAQNIEIKDIDLSNKDYVDLGDGNYKVVTESLEYGWYKEDNLPENLNDFDLVNEFFKWFKTKKMKKAVLNFDMTKETVNDMIAQIDQKLTEIEIEEKNKEELE